ncbi:hypothetical protein [Micromonospora sp. CPCC 206061]|uniref:hypothetical protein n=1 Tax=Micromonospora sp. CPCC 206061 TaxID=3122410 RepID=UPI002FF259FD
MSRLDERYRAVLRLLPADYRARWEQEMVAAFLESMETGDPEQDEYVRDYGRPSWSEVGSVAALAVRLRLGGAGTPRSVTWGAAVRLAVLMALLANAVSGTSGAAFRLWLAGTLSWLPDPPATWMAQIPSGFWYVSSDLSGLFWLAAYVAFLNGHLAAGRAFIGLGMLPGAVVAVISTVGLMGVSPSVTLWTALLADGALLLGTVAFQPGAAPVRIRPWLWALPVGVVTVAGLWLGIVATALLDWAGLHAVLAVAAALAYLGGIALRLLRPAAAWSLALLVLVVAVLAARLITLLDYAMLDPASDRAAWLAVGAAEAAMLLAVGAPLAVLAARALPRRVPA